MMRTENAVGGYAFLPGPSFASNGVVAMPGMSIHRAMLPKNATMSEGFAAIRTHLEIADRPLEALCGIEIRMPKALALEEFLRFNVEYLTQLDSLGLLANGTSPMARTNVAPTSDAPAQSSITAFSYTMAETLPQATFVISGVAEVPDGVTQPEDVIRAGESGADALLDKARFVVNSVTARVLALGAVWDAGASVHLYTVHDVAFALAREVLAKKGLTPTHGIVWHDAAPPVLGLELEIDVRHYSRESIVTTLDSP